MNTTITENTTLGELLAILGPVSKAKKTPTPKKLREEAGEPIAMEERCKVYSNGYAVYDNGCGITVLWVPNCTSYSYGFDPMKDTEKGGEIKQGVSLPEGFLESQPWTIALTLIGDHRVEMNCMNRRQGGRKGSKDYVASDYGDHDGDVEEAVEESYRDDYTWRDDRVGEDPETIILRKEKRREMLGLMTPEQKEVFLLYYQYGYTQVEIAEMLGIGRSSVRSRLEYALKKAKKFL